MAYDAARNVVLLFGGGGLNDTWIWDGTLWTQLNPPQIPPPRTSACMTYDSLHHTVLLFGGVSVGGLPLADTWQWNGTTWTQLLPPQSPPARLGAVMAYAEAQQVVVLFSGESFGKRVGFLLNDTWIWNGTQWNHQSLPASPSSRVGATMIYDPANQQLVLFGGTSGSSVYSDTWIWDGHQWQQHLPTVSPPARAWATMVYATSLQQAILVGGSSVSTNPSISGLNDTWQWDGATWSPLISASAPTGGYNSAAYDATQQALIMYASTNSKSYPSNKQGSSQTNPNASSLMRGETWIWHAG